MHELSKPEIIGLKANRLSVYYQHNFTYFDSALGIKQHLQAGVVSFGVEHSNIIPGEDMLAGWYAGADSIPQDALASFVQFKGLLNTCINHAEVINRAFLELTRRFLNDGRTDIKAISHLDFMKLKDGLMQYVKSDRSLHSLTNKSFRRSLDSFITYRNIFTHGDLCFVYSSDGILALGEYYLRFIDRSTRIEVITPVDKELVVNFISTYEQILAFINAFTNSKSLK